MRNFTSFIKAFSCALLTLFFAVPASAQSEWFGTYEFTADVEITADGQQYADLFKSKCDVTIDKHAVYDFTITGIGGGTESGQTANLKGSNVIEVKSGNGTYTLWPNKIAWADANGDRTANPKYTINEATKEITMPDFIAMSLTPSWEMDKVLARFTNCKMTLKKQEEVVVTDMSGEYHFVATGSQAGSSVPAEFDMTLTAKDETFKTYSVVIDYGEGYVPVNLDADYDGYVLTIPFADAYLNEEKTLFFNNGRTSVMKSGVITFKYVSDISFSLDGEIMIMKGETETSVVLEQGYLGGNAVKAAKDADNFAGTYHVVCNDLNVFLTDDEYNWNYPKEFDMTIEKSEYNSMYYVRAFVSGDIYMNTQGYYPCTVKGNTLQIPVGDNMNVHKISVGEEKRVYDVLYSGLGENTGTVDFTIDADGKCTLGDFFLFRKTIVNSSGEINFEMGAYYGSLTVTTGGDGIVALDAPASQKVTVADGAIRIVGGPAAVKVYNAAGTCVFSGVASVVNGLNKGLYIVKCGDTVVKLVL